MKRVPKDQDLLRILKEMESLQEQYPEDLLAARRASFLEQMTKPTPARAGERLELQDQKIVDRLRSLGSAPAVYPPHLMAARRQAFVRRIYWLNFVSLGSTVWLFIRDRILTPVFQPHVPVLRKTSASFLAAGLALAVFIGFLLFAYRGSVSPLPDSQHGTVQSGRMLTSDTRAVKIICKSGVRPPLCLAGEYKKNDALTYQGNGSARPAVAKDTKPGSGELHKAAYANDGLYGPAASWVSNSRNSWIKIDLGKATEINTVTFGRDRLGKLRGHDPGQFVVSLALTDNVYADGNNTNDNKEYRTVFKSQQSGFSGTISGADTVIAQFPAQEARYIKITFENKGTVIDEVEAFMVQPPLASSLPDTSSGAKPSTDSSGSQAGNTNDPSNVPTSLPVNTATALATKTLVPTLTLVPTKTSAPSQTATPVPTSTNVPTNTLVPTSTPVPTSTAVPTSSSTPTTAPSNTPVPPPTNTNTPVPPPTNTPVPPPTNTPVPPPTNTPVPPDTAIPAPTGTPISTGSLPRIDYYGYLTSTPSVP